MKTTKQVSKYMQKRETFRMGANDDSNESQAYIPKGLYHKTVARTTK